MAHATALLLCAVMNALSDEPLSFESSAQQRAATAPSNSTQLLALPSLHSGQVAPARTGPGAQMRALEKFRRVWDAAGRSGRIWKLEATKGRAGPGELVHCAQNPLSSEGGALTRDTG